MIIAIQAASICLGVFMYFSMALFVRILIDATEDVYSPSGFHEWVYKKEDWFAYLVAAVFVGLFVGALLYGF